MSLMESEEDLTTLLKNISSAKYPEIITFLLKLREVVGKNENKQSVKAKNDILNFGMLPILTFSLKQKFWKFEDGWNSFSKLARFLVELCVGANPSDLPDFAAKMLPDALDSVLYLANRLQKKITLMAEGGAKQSLLMSFTNVIDSTSMLLASFQELAKLALESIWLQQMLMSEDELTTPRVMALVQTVNKTRTGIFETISKETSRQVMDELVYKILITKNPDIVSAAARTIVEICKSCPSEVKALTTRYRGLKTYADKWIQEPFLGELLLLLDTGSIEQARLKMFEHQAIQIQSWWRSCLARKRLRQANSALSLFQRSFRERKEREDLGHREEKMQADLQYLLAKQRKYNMRKLHWRQLHAIQILPSSQVEKYLIQEQTTAATKIQAAWRRYAALRNVPVLRQRHILNQAAIKIQRAYRRYSTRKRREEKLFGRPTTLKVSEQRRSELQEQIADWRENRRQAERTAREMERLHERVQSRLGEHFLARYEDSGRLGHLEALVAHTMADADLLLSTTDRAGIENSTTVMQSLKSCSVPVAMKAKEEHMEKLRQLNMPWWKKLSVETEETGVELLHGDWRIF